MMLEPFFELELGFAGSYDKKPVQMFNGRNDSIIVVIEFSRKDPLPLIVGRNLMCFVRPAKRRITGTLGVLLNLGIYHGDGLIALAPHDDDRSSMIDPNAGFCGHSILLLNQGRAGRVRTPRL
jgi:hypothetical protein